MELISPPILKSGDLIGIVAPARKVEQSQIEPAIKILESWGLEVLLGENLYGEFNQFSGTDKERAADFQKMIENPEVKAVLCARGGYGTIRIFDHINLRTLQREPKWIVGYSDITVLHGILNSWYMMETIHGIMPINFPANGVINESTESLRKVLFGHSPLYSFNHHPFNHNGTSQGAVQGGNLSILCSASGTDADITLDGKILFIEDLDEYLYHIDRMMMNLKRSNKLKNLAGLVVGGMTDMNDNPIPYGYNAQEIIRDAVMEYDFPVCFDFPAGHLDRNLALIFGRKATLKVDEAGCYLAFSPSTYKK